MDSRNLISRRIFWRAGGGMNRSRERIHVSFFGEARDAENSLTVAIENDNGGERVYTKVSSSSEFTPRNATPALPEYFFAMFPRIGSSM